MYICIRIKVYSIYTYIYISCTRTHQDSSPVHKGVFPVKYFVNKESPTHPRNLRQKCGERRRSTWFLIDSVTLVFADGEGAVQFIVYSSNVTFLLRGDHWT